MRELFEKHSRPIMFYLEIEKEDPYGLGRTSKKYQTYITKNAIVNDIDYARIAYKLPGLQVEEAKEIIIEKTALSIFLNSKKIIIDGKEYSSWKDNTNKVRYKDLGEFISAYIYRRN